MSYSEKVKAAVKTTPNTLGVQLARIAVKKGVSVIRIAQHTGASRTTVYSWFSGRGVTNAYAAVVRATIAQIKADAL